MNIDYSFYKNILIIKPVGEMDHHNIERHREDTGRYFEQRHAKSIVFDLSEVSFIDSSGIGYIIGRYKMTLLTGGKTAVANPSEKVSKIFRCAGLDSIIKTYPSVETALAELTGEGV